MKSPLFPDRDIQFNGAAKELDQILSFIDNAVIHSKAECQAYLGGGLSHLLQSYGLNIEETASALRIGLFSKVDSPSHGINLLFKIEKPSGKISDFEVVDTLAD